MNNRAQQNFDRSIADAVKVAAQATQRDRAATARDVRVPMTREEKLAARRKPRGRLFLDPATGATVWDPNG